MQKAERRVFYLHGIAASSGDASGPAVVLPPIHRFLPERESLTVDQERQLLEKGIEQALDHLRRFEEGQPEPIREMLHLQQVFLRDPQLADEIEIQLAAGYNAPTALFRALEVLKKRFTESANDFYRQRWVDFEDAGRTVLDILLGVSYEETCLERVRTAGDRPVVVAFDLAPAMYLKMPKPAAIILRDGGPSGHLALLAANQGIPILVRTGPAAGFERISAGNWIEIHGETVAVYEAREPVSDVIGPSALTGVRQDNRITLADGRGVRLSLNADDAGTIREHGLHHRVSVGLFRTEFLYLRDTSLLFDEKRSVEAYGEVMRAAGQDGSVTFRLLDVDEDKFSAHFFTKPGNRGLRGADYYRAEPEIFHAQIRSLFQAAIEHGSGAELRIMAPMMRTPEDWQFVLSALQGELERSGYEGPFRAGMMIEIPSALFSMERMQHSVDFFSLGTNDLLRYVIGKSRSQPAPDDLYEPAFYRLLFHGMRRIKREISICGMMGARVEFLPLFLELGVTNFSVPLGAYETVRQRLMSIDPQQRMLRALLRMQSRAEIRKALQS